MVNWKKTMMAAAGGDGPSGYIVGVESNNLTNNNLFVVDISDNTNPSVVGNLQYGYFRTASSIVAYPSQERVYVCDGYNGRITCVNMSDPTNPSIAGSKNVFSSGYLARKIGIVGDVLILYEHRNGDSYGRLSSYDLTSSLTNPTQIDSVTGTTGVQMQCAWFDNDNGRLWMGSIQDTICVWDYSDTSNLSIIDYNNFPFANVDGPEPITGYGDKAIYAETADGQFGIATVSGGTISTSNTGSLGKTANSNGMGIRLSSDGYCYFACANFSQAGGFVLPHAQLSDGGTTSNFSSSSLTSLSGGSFAPGNVATDNTENYLYFASWEASTTGSSQFLVLDVTNRTSPTEVSTITLTGYNVYGFVNTLCHYNP